jgi:hypothetical protein
MKRSGSGQARRRKQVGHRRQRQSVGRYHVDCLLQWQTLKSKKAVASASPLTGLKPHHINLMALF